LPKNVGAAVGRNDRETKCDRAIYNRLKRNLQTALKDARNDTFEQFITSFSPDDTSLWKATKSFERPQVSITDPEIGWQLGKE